MKKNFKGQDAGLNDGEFQVYWNEKEYGAAKTRYMTITRLSGSQGQREIKGAYSVTEERFTQWTGSNLDLVKAAARALDFI